ncbi:uncharacterized protein LOC133466105 isoform X2 [Phyllopteryx taeniolatus]|uniref:uncharacterized protein LOC133466105 isoform X2 n=1 Tax=Phyllopteryx taeniolatus TaxID=161469 RepID=UPI002AD43F7E|nr:uncharacterized protein LOC133466105 isoform X2 [Phyllopteryx taeniolatus]
MDSTSLEPSLYTVKAVFILDNDGNRLLSKYYDPELYSSMKDQRNFEKNIFNKTHKADSSGKVALKSVSPHPFHRGCLTVLMEISSTAQLMLMSVLNCLFDCLSQILRINRPEEDPARRTWRHPGHHQTASHRPQPAIHTYPPPVSPIVQSFLSFSSGPPTCPSYSPCPTILQSHVSLDSDFSDCEDGPDLVNLLSDSESDTDLDFSGSFPSLSRPRQFLSRLPVSNPSESKSFPSDLFLGTRLAIYPGPPHGGQRRRPSKGQILPPRCFSPVHKSLNLSPVPTRCSTAPIKSRLVKPAPKPPCSVQAIFSSSPSRDLVHSSTPVPSTPKPQWRQAEEATAGPVPAPRQLRQAPVPAPRQLR